jgi:hypothetical protein
MDRVTNVLDAWTVSIGEVRWLLPALALLALTACATQTGPRPAAARPWALWSSHWAPEYGQQQHWIRVEEFETREACYERRRSYLHSAEQARLAQGTRSWLSGHTLYTLDSTSRWVLGRDRYWCSDATLVQVDR